jgi:leucyl aminopeptidase
MNYADLKLDTRLEFGLKNENVTSTQNIKVTIVDESELKNTVSPWMASAKLLFLEIRARGLYPGSADGSEFFYVMPTEVPKGLASHPSGPIHTLSHLGANFATTLLNSPFLAARNHVDVTFSEIAKKRTFENFEWFLIGALQRATTQKGKTSYRTQKESQKLALTLCDSELCSRKFNRGMALHNSMTVTRSLVCAPGNILNPETYELFVRELVRDECESSQNPNLISMEVMRLDKLREEGCGLIEAVGKGSDIPPRIIRLVYQPRIALQPSRHVTLVGKGITFDTGGLDIKPPGGMRNMKKDMGGSACVLGSFLALAKLGTPARITCYLALAENMVSGNSMRPGDIYRSRTGHTVEIENTDAEGRLVLADALSLAAQDNPDCIIDVATLTGAARVSLGGSVDSLFSNNVELEKLLFQAGLETGDWVWPMPLVDEYESLFDSQIADMMNASTSGHAGSVTAALFLRKFVGKTKWAHIDSYMWADRPFDIYGEAGGTAKCVRLLTCAVQQFLGQPLSHS